MTRHFLKARNSQFLTKASNSTGDVYNDAIGVAFERRFSATLS